MSLTSRSTQRPPLSCSISQTLSGVIGMSMCRSLQVRQRIYHRTRDRRLGTDRPELPLQVLLADFQQMGGQLARPVADLPGRHGGGGAGGGRGATGPA